MQHLGDVSDPTLLILKAHLVIEEILYSVVARKMKNPRILAEANLRFGQLLYLARALFETDSKAEFASFEMQNWDFIRTLNVVRNQLAHKLDTDPSAAMLRLMGPKNPPLNSPEFKPVFLVSISMAVGAVMSLPQRNRRAAGLPKNSSLSNVRSRGRQT